VLEAVRWEERRASASAKRRERERRRAASESAWRVDAAEMEAVSMASRMETTVGHRTAVYAGGELVLGEVNEQEK